MDSDSAVKLKMIRLARRLLRQVKEREENGQSVGAYRRAFSLLIRALRMAIDGGIPPERLMELDSAIDRFERSDGFDKRDLKSQNRYNSPTPIDKSPHSDIIKSGKPNTDAKEKGGENGKSDWVTINGTHVQINENGLVTKGPENLMGKSVSDETTSIKSEVGVVKPFSLADCRKTVMKYGISDAKALYESAKQGKRHGGIYRDAIKKTQTRLEKSISSHVSQVEEHADKLKHPIEHDIGWTEKNERQKEGLLHKWEKDLKRNAEQASIEMEVWKERFENDD